MRDRKDLIGTINPEGVQAVQLEVLLDIRDLLLEKRIEKDETEDEE